MYVITKNPKLEMLETPSPSSPSFSKSEIIGLKF